MKGSPEKKSKKLKKSLDFFRGGKILLIEGLNSYAESCITKQSSRSLAAPADFPVRRFANL